jgi:large subunit ribosomal protein L16
MPLMPKRVKYRQSQRGSRKGMAMSGNTLAFGEYGLRAMERAGSPTSRSKPAAWR